MKQIIALFATQIVSISTAEKAIVMPRRGRVVGIQLAVSATGTNPTGSTCWVSQAALAGSFVDGSPILAYLTMITQVLGLTFGYQNGSAIFVPQNLSVSANQTLILSVTDTGATSTGIAIVQFVPD